MYNLYYKGFNKKVYITVKRRGGQKRFYSTAKLQRRSHEVLL